MLKVWFTLYAVTEVVFSAAVVCYVAVSAFSAVAIDAVAKGTVVL